MKDTRRKRLNDLLVGPRFLGDRSKFCQDARITNGRLTQLLDENEVFGDVAARNLTRKLDLPENYFDQKEALHPYPPKVDHPHTEHIPERRHNHHTIPSLEDACNTLARYFEAMPEEDRDNAGRWLLGLAHRPSSAPHVIGALMEMVVTPRKSPPEKSTGT